MASRQCPRFCAFSVSSSCLRALISVPSCARWTSRISGVSRSMPRSSLRTWASMQLTKFQSRCSRSLRGLAQPRSLARRYASRHGRGCLRAVRAWMTPIPNRQLEGDSARRGMRSGPSAVRYGGVACRSLLGSVCQGRPRSAAHRARSSPGPFSEPSEHLANPVLSDVRSRPTLIPSPWVSPSCRLYPGRPRVLEGRWLAGGAVCYRAGKENSESRVVTVRRGCQSTHWNRSEAG